MHSVLFICTANICRSPMAAALMRARLRNEQPDWWDWRVDSAGTWALDGETAAKNSRQVMFERGLDITNHRAKTVTEAMLKEYDLILTMEPGQKEALRIEYPSLARRVFLLDEMGGGTLAVDDPYGGPLVGYRKTAETIDQMLARGMPRIIELAGRHDGRERINKE